MIMLVREIKSQNVTLHFQKKPLYYQDNYDTNEMPNMSFIYQDITLI